MRYLVIFCLTLFLGALSAYAATVPQIASGMGRELDRQVVEHLGLGEAPAKGISLMITTPVNSNNLEEANPLARQVQEELARWFVQAGYKVQEIRKSADIMFTEETGEIILTRNTGLLNATKVGSGAVLTGTYTITPSNVRFNIRLVQTASQQVLAMSTASVPITSELRPLLSQDGGGTGMGGPIEPTVMTRLP